MQKSQLTGIISILLLVFFLSNAQPGTPELSPVTPPTCDEESVINLVSAIQHEAPIIQNNNEIDEISKKETDSKEDDEEVVFPFTVDVTVPLFIYMGLYFLWVDQVNRYIKDQAGNTTFIGRHNDACSEVIKVASGYFLLERFKEQVKLIEGYVYKKGIKPFALFVKHYFIAPSAETVSATN